MAPHSLFRVGADVELWRVVGHLCILLAFLVLVEQLLHRAEHALERYPKYANMLRKGYRELMILGLISLGLKAVKELALADPNGENMLAFQAADIIIFLSALALILQAICIFAVLRRHNIRRERYELVTTGDLAELVSHHEAVMRSKNWLQRHWPWTRSTGLHESMRVRGEERLLSSARYRDMTRLRVLRHFFLRTQGLPELFPFSKYLRYTQDNQITHMIEVDISVWILLMGISWLLDIAAWSFEHSYGESVHGFALVTVLTVFAWSVTICHALFAFYLNRLIRSVLASCGYAAPNQMLKALRTIASDEERQYETDILDNAMEKMQRVQDEKELEQVSKDTKYTGFARHDTGLQLIILLFRRLCGKPAATAKPPAEPSTKPPRNRRLRTCDVEEDLEAGDAGPEEEEEAVLESPRRQPKEQAKMMDIAPLNLFFSRKITHFIVKLLLVLNGFFFALMCSAVLYDLPEIYRHSGPIVTALVPIPLILNIVYFQPRIFRDYVLVACIFKVDVATLSEVITQFSESVELRAEFVGHLTSRMRENGQTMRDLRLHFQVSDPGNSGLIELEELRQILRHFGCQVSYFRFNDVAKLLFRLKGTCVEYAQVERLVELAQMEDDASVVAGESISHLPHYMRAVMAEEAEMNGRERCSTMSLNQAWRFPNDSSHSNKAHQPLYASSSFGGSHFRPEATVMPMALTPVTPQTYGMTTRPVPTRSPGTGYVLTNDSHFISQL